MIQILWSSKYKGIHQAVFWGLVSTALLFLLAGCSLFSALESGQSTIDGALDKPPLKAEPPIKVGLDMAECQAVAYQAISLLGTGVHTGVVRAQLAMEAAGLTQEQAQSVFDMANVEEIRDRATATYADTALTQMDALLIAVGCPSLFGKG